MEEDKESVDGFADEKLWRHAALVDFRRNVESGHKRHSDLIKAIFASIDILKSEALRLEREIEKSNFEIRLINNNGFVTRIDKLDTRTDSLEATRNWGKGVATVLSILWTVLLIYIATKIKG